MEAKFSLILKTALMLSLATLAIPASAQTDLKAVKDHPLISRYPGSEVLEYKTAEFDEFPLPLGKIIDNDQFTKTQKLEGKVTKFRYSVPADRSALEIASNYRSSLDRAGFQIIFQCSGLDCKAPKSFYGSYRRAASGVWCFECEDAMHYVAAKLSRPTGDIYVALVVEKDKYEGGAWLSIIEIKPMAAGLVKVNAAALSEDITAAGHAPIYGIYFDTGKSVVKPESDPTLVEIAKLLTANPQLKLHVVGHTDNAGTLVSNMALSKQRAEAVVAALSTQYHIASSRLLSAGVGPLAPVATNQNEDGRAKNRRVELVEQ